MPGAVPVSNDISGPVTGGDPFTATITLDQTVTTDTQISLQSSNTSVVSGPSSATVLAGHNSVVVPFTSSPVPTNTNVTLYAGPGGATLPGGATASKTFEVAAGPAP